MAEHGLTGTVLGVIFDGTGFGTDGAVWGGEFLAGDASGFRRVAHLRYVGMPGGDQAIREPWRMAAAHAADAGVPDSPLSAHCSQIALRAVRRMLARQVNCPPTSSVGRLFDAVAALTGARGRVTYEGQAAIELEWLAAELPPAPGYAFELTRPADAAAPLVVDTRPLVRDVVEDVRRGAGAAAVARRLHTTLVDVVSVVCRAARERTGLSGVVLSGGVFLNALLTQEVAGRLAAEGFTVYRHRLVPPGDGGLSLGQLAVAACRLARSRPEGSDDVPGDTR
jgi:hydrogenase maturation protein HypF